MLILDLLVALPTSWDAVFDISKEQLNICLWLTMFKFLLVVTLAKYSNIVANVSYTGD